MSALVPLTLRARSWRSWHFVPGASDKMLGKANGLGADALLLDLEDSVSPEGKDAARARVAEWLTAPPGRAARIVRINPFDTPWGRDDLSAVARYADAILVPKVESAAGIEEIDSALHQHEATHSREARSVGLVAIATETPRGLLSIDEIAQAPRIIGLTWGAEDLSAALGATRSRDSAGRYLRVFEHARTMTLLAAAAAGVAAIDGVYTNFSDSEGFAAEAEDASATGFTGKMSIHPSQIPVLNAAFTPSIEAVEEATELIAAYQAHSASGSGAFAFGGEMIDAPHLARARGLLARAQRTEN
jgi:citrate lyase subunit beta/citryl-CoA lyase